MNRCEVRNNILLRVFYPHLNGIKLIVMPIYHALGSIPHKRHTVFRKPDGKLYAEELVSTEGFSGMYSLVYHAQIGRAHV